jgi:hypothetical protein
VTLFCCREEQGIPTEFVEVGDLSSWQIEPDRAIADLFSHRSGGQQSREAALEQLLNKLNT